MNFAAPTSQSAGDRPIVFMLDDRLGVGPFVEPVELSVRPESLSRQDPSRLSVQQTLGGAWVDSFGASLASITISGNTGWRRNSGTAQSNNGQDGEGRFFKLRDTVFTQWHERRARAIQAGQDPDQIKLFFADSLDKISAVVAPQSFVLQRSRSRPLLMQYQISMVVLSEGSSNSAFSSLSSLSSLLPKGDVLRTLGLGSLADTITKIQSWAGQAVNFIDNAIGKPVAAFMNKAAGVYGAVVKAVRSVEGIGSSLIAVARDVSRAGANIARTINLIATLPQRAKAFWGQVAGAFTNAFCLLRNSIKNLATYDDYSSVYGASNCSSTSGGRPISSLSDTNTFNYVIGAPSSPPVSVTAAAQQSLQSMAGADVVMNAPSRTMLSSSVNVINLGLVVA